MAIAHGGHGTTIMALAAGVPTLVLPVGRDQPDNAERVAASGAGLRLKPSSPSAALRRAVAELLDDDRYAHAAQRLAAAIREDTSTDRAVAELEAVARGAQNGGGGIRTLERAYAR